MKQSRFAKSLMSKEMSEDVEHWTTVLELYGQGAQKIVTGMCSVLSLIPNSKQEYVLQCLVTCYRGLKRVQRVS